ncbi:hypothetical protein FOVSG1_009550 [Fusarium oxysporum f. sp. vasinfectum]
MALWQDVGRCMIAYRIGRGPRMSRADRDSNRINERLLHISFFFALSWNKAFASSVELLDRVKAGHHGAH